MRWFIRDSTCHVFFFEKNIRRRSNGHVTVQFLVESTDFFVSYHGCVGFEEPCAVEGICPTQLESHSAPCKVASCCSRQVGDAQEASKDLAGAAGGACESGEPLRRQLT